MNRYTNDDFSVAGYVYVLIDPNTHSIRYVGLTNNPKQRLSSHIYQCGSTSKKDKWLRSLKATGKVPVMRVIDVVYGTKEDLGRAETLYISEYRARGFDLTNTRRGGQLGGRRKERDVPENEDVNVEQAQTPGQFAPWQMEGIRNGLGRMRGDSYYLASFVDFLDRYYAIREGAREAGNTDVIETLVDALSFVRTLPRFYRRLAWLVMVSGKDMMPNHLLGDLEDIGTLWWVENKGDVLRACWWDAFVPPIEDE